MKVLVTGASGFVGRHFVAALAAQGGDVVAVSRRRPDVLEGVEWRPTPDLERGANWIRLLDDCDAVVHLAGIAHRRVSHHKQYLVDLQRVNVEATAGIYTTARILGIQRFIFASSLAAVTSHSIGLVDESTSARPTSDYGRSKLAAEKVLSDLAARGGTPLTVLRPPVIYGGGDPGNMDRLFRLIRFGFPLPFGGLQNRRSLIYVGNLCDIMLKFLLAPAPCTGTYFVSDGHDLGTTELIRMAAAAMGRRARLWRLPQRFWNAVARLQPDGSIAKVIGSLYLDISLLRNTLGWSPAFTPEQGLRATFAKGNGPD